MKKIVIVLGFFTLCFSAQGQIKGTSLPSLPSLTTAEMNGATGVNIGSSVFNTDDQKVYRFTTTGWVTNTDNQLASEVDSDSPVDIDGDGTNEPNVEEMIQDLAPISSKAARVFYPPSIEIDASANVLNATKNLYTEYTAQFASPNTVASTGAPSAVPIYAANELYYYVTYFDPAVFANVEIDANGVMEYDIIGQPTNYNTLINVVFVVK
ncbi:hypothetical protein ACFSQJ_00005 [Croceitalea marina]|uniref:Uncharacterized protein n=1 Tax=Croceitalea marina TaxID=1775166 RepID=A0ABW5MR67_9FLAO